MRSLYNFIIRPYKERYDNVKFVDGKELLINTNIENHLFVSKKAVVVSTPAAFDTDIRCGDIVYVHHNLFRRWYDQKGKERNSSTYFKDDLYFCDIHQIFMYNLKCHLDYCFVKPIKEKSHLTVNNEKEHFGILKYSNSSLEAVGLKPGALVIFTPNSEFEFIIDDEKLYCMKSKDIAITYGRKENQKEYNSSGSTSSSRVDKSSKRTDSGYGRGCNCGSFEECRCY